MSVLPKLANDATIRLILIGQELSETMLPRQWTYH